MSIAIPDFVSSRWVVHLLKKQTCRLACTMAGNVDFSAETTRTTYGLFRALIPPQNRFSIRFPLPQQHLGQLA